MAARRLSRPQRQILHLMWAQYERTQAGMSTGHLEWVQALGRDKSNVSHSLRTLEARGLITIGRSAGGEGHPFGPHSRRPKIGLESLSKL